eukprot:scaffold4443_cov92-Skeletonema_dohrnii-CCMP3373.AAC.1
MEHHLRTMDKQKDEQRELVVSLGLGLEATLTLSEGTSEQKDEHVTRCPSTMRKIFGRRTDREGLFEDTNFEGPTYTTSVTAKYTWTEARQRHWGIVYASDLDWGHSHCTERERATTALLILERYCE